MISNHKTFCDLCGDQIHPSAFDDGIALYLGKDPKHFNTKHLCAGCRYEGAGEFLANKQFAGDRIAIEISGGLWSSFRYSGDIQQYVSTTGYRLARPLDELGFHEAEDLLDAMKQDLMSAYHALSEQRSILGNVINELHRLGWPIQIAYKRDLNRDNDNWPEG